jgi:peptidoglycan DL-endopeptidase CwlO
VSNHVSGRHRGPNRLNPASSLSSAISRSAKPAAKASAVFVISGGMVASFAFPASAAPLTPVKPKAPAATATGAIALAAPSTAQSPLVAPSFGDIGFTGVAKPKPVPVTLSRTSDRASRTGDRASRTSERASRTTSRASRSATRLPVAQAAARVPAPRSAGVLGIAAGLAGISYRYGGTSPAGFDCSGFTQYIFNRIGVSLPRTAEAQRQFATPVSNPQPGDLVFFGAPAHHMGIYAGNGKMWDSPRSGSSTSLRSIYSSGVTYGRV